jgi:hypothetical protein
MSNSGARRLRVETCGGVYICCKNSSDQCYVTIRTAAVSSSNVSQQLQTLRTTLFWFITQRVVVIPCRRFGTTCLNHFTFMWPCIVINFFIIKPTDALSAQIYFVKKLYMFWAIPLPIIRSFPLYIRDFSVTFSSDRTMALGRLSP